MILTLQPLSEKRPILQIATAMLAASVSGCPPVLVGERETGYFVIHDGHPMEDRPKQESELFASASFR